jgi:hypothetical protein
MSNRDSIAPDVHLIMIEKEIVSTLFDAAIHEVILTEQVRPIARELLHDFEQLHTFDQAMIFLETISKKWSFFEPLCDKYYNAIEEAEKRVHHRTFHHQASYHHS